MENLIKARAQKIKLIKYIFLSTGCCVLIAIVTSLYAQNTLISKDFTSSSQEDHSRLPKDYTLSINHSVIEGVSSDLMPYKISAENIVKNSANKYVLNSVNGKYSLDDGDISIKATKGILDEVTKSFTLTDDAQVIFNGVVFSGKEIIFNLHSKDATSNKEVEVVFEQSSIKADSFKIEDSTNSIEFKGNVKSNFNIDK